MGDRDRNLRGSRESDRGYETLMFECDCHESYQASFIEVNLLEYAREKKKRGGGRD